jgi:hypothetical protein
LLARSELALNKAQAGRIAALASEWSLEKERYAEALARYSPQRGSLESLKAGMADYSRLSQDYDAAREAKWREALAVLNPDQRGKVSK